MCRDNISGQFRPMVPVEEEEEEADQLPTGFRVNRSYCHRNYRSDLLMCRDHISGQFRPMVSDEEEEEGASSAKQ